MGKFESLRNSFPFLKESSHQGQPLIYWDNAASAQKPDTVLKSIEVFYKESYANIHRGVYRRAVKATEKYESARTTCAEFIGANSNEIIFTKGTTEGINLVAQSYLSTLLKEGDNIISTELEHHSNFVPWQILCEHKKAEQRVLRINEVGELDLENVEQLIDSRTRLVAINHISNSLGVVNNVEKIIAIAKSKGVPILLDAAQSITQLPIDVKKMDIDFLVFSGHKLYGPSGIGVLYAKTAHLQNMKPYQYGGDMIRSVQLDKTTFKDGPSKFEAGTPNMVGAIGMANAMDFLSKIGLASIHEHQKDLTKNALQILKDIEGVKIIGPGKGQLGIISFLYKEVHPHDIASIFDMEGIAIRAGHHCTEPLMKKLNVPGTARISFGIYNTKKELESLPIAFEKIKSIFG